MRVSARQLEALHGVRIIPDSELILSRLERIEARLDAMPKPKDPVAVDLVPVIQRLDDIETALSATPVAAPVNLDAITTRLARIEKALADMPQRPASYEFNINRDADGKITKVTTVHKSKKMIG